MRMLAPLVDEHGPVKHIVCGSAAIEHKIYSGPFSKKFPSADVWLPPKNWSFPAGVPEDAAGGHRERRRRGALAVPDRAQRAGGGRELSARVQGPLVRGHGVLR